MSNRIVVTRVPNISDDLGICDVARVSFNKLASMFSVEKNHSLLRYLFAHRHWSPFGQARIQLTFNLTDTDLVHFFNGANLAGFKWEITGFNAVGRTYHFNGSVWAWYENWKHFPQRLWKGIFQAIYEKFGFTFSLFWNALSYGEIVAIEADAKPGVSTLVEPSNLSSSRLTHVTFRGEAPIFVVRQLGKHQVGLTWNEVSRRYVDVPVEHYDMEDWRTRPEQSIKQGSGGVIEDPEILKNIAYIVCNCRKVTDAAYETLVNDIKVAPEQARSVLMQDMQTEWIWTGALCDFKRICNERLAPGAQKESRLFAEQIDALLTQEFGSKWTGHP